MKGVGWGEGGPGGRSSAGVVHSGGVTTVGRPCEVLRTKGSDQKQYVRKALCFTFILELTC